MKITKVCVEDTSFVNLGIQPSYPNTNTWAYQNPITKQTHAFIRFPEGQMAKLYIRYNWDRLTQADYDGYRRRINLRCKNLRLRN